MEGGENKRKDGKGCKRWKTANPNIKEGPSYQELSDPTMPPPLTTAEKQDSVALKHRRFPSWCSNPSETSFICTYDDHSHSGLAAQIATPFLDKLNVESIRSEEPNQATGTLVSTSGPPGPKIRRDLNPFQGLHHSLIFFLRLCTSGRFFHH